MSIDENRRVWLRPPAAAQHLSLAEQTLAQMRWRGTGPRYFKIGKAVLYDRDTLDAWVAERARTSTSDAGTCREEVRA
jgi:predicted DNA-binding transcriptional regulator AlpA